MKKYLLILLLFFLPGLLMGADFEGGDGTKSKPFLISTHQQLAKLSNYCGAGHQNTCFALSRDIQIPSGTEWQPIGQFISSSDYSGAFQGNLDGRGHQISNLSITTSSQPHIGLFACIANAHIIDLHLSNAQITQELASISSAGILSANSHESSIRYCSVSGDVLSFYTAGGMIGNDLGNNHLEYNSSKSNVSASFYAGGFIGRSTSGGSDYSSCKAEGNVSLSNETNRLFDTFYQGYAGGFIAWHEKQGTETTTTFVNCSTKSTLKANSADKYFYMGGFAGFISLASLENCSSSGTVQVSASSNTCLGGFSAESILTDYINCTSKGSVEAQASSDQATSGGFTGKNDGGSYKNCYADCTISTSLSSSAGESVSGGFIGYNSRYTTLNNCYTKGSIEAQSTNSSHVVAGGITGYDRQGQYWDNINLSSIKGTSSSSNIYIGGIIGHTSTSNLSGNGFSSEASIIANNQTSSLAHQGSNKNGEIINQIHSIQTWESAQFVFGQSIEMPWVMPEGASSTPILYFEQNPEWDSSFAISPSSVQIARKSSHSQTVSVISPTTWTATSNDSWITIQTASGAAGSSSLTITASTNSSAQTRSGTVTITSNGRIRTLSVIQESDLSPMEKWLVEHGIPSDGTSPEASSSNDGMSNLEKYALGLDPASKQPSPGTPEIKEDAFQVSYPFQKVDDPNLQITGERLVDINNPLAGWTSEGVSISTVEKELILKSATPVSSINAQVLRLRFTLSQDTRSEASSTTSTPYAYSTSELLGNQKKWINEAVHKPYQYASVIDTEKVTLSCADQKSNAVTLSDPDFDFTEIIQSGTCYRLEIDFGSAGTVSILLNKQAWMNPGKDAWILSATSLTFDDAELASMLRDKTSTPTFVRIREARVISDHFGLQNEVGLKQGSVLSADSLFVYSEPSYKKIYYSGSEWKGTGIPSSYTLASMPLTPHKPLQCQRKKGDDLELTMLGEILQTPQIITLTSREETIGTELPLHQKLRTTGIEKSLGESFTPTNSDGIYLPTPDPSAKYYFYNGAWRLRSNSSDDEGDAKVEGIMTIYRRVEDQGKAIISPILTPPAS